MQGRQNASPPSPPTLCVHPRGCASILSTAGPSPALWGPRLTGHRHAHRYAPSGLPSAKPSNWRMDEDQTRAPALLPSKPPLDGYRIRHDTCQRQNVPGRLSIPRHCTPCCRTHRLEPRSVNRLPPSPIKRGGGPLAVGGRRIATHSHFRLHLRYWHFASINPQRLGGSSSSPASFVAPLYEHHGALQYNTTSAPLLGVWPTTGTRINPVS
jgi:hypothetical protein